MRYNPDTERGIRIEDVCQPFVAGPSLYPQPEKVWSSGKWIDNPLYKPENEIPPERRQQDIASQVISLTVKLWDVRHQLQQFQPGELEQATIGSLTRDVHEVAFELTRLSIDRERPVGR